MKTVGVTGDPNLDSVQAALSALGELRELVVLVGGCATGLLLTAARSEMIRPTRDVDLVVEVVSMRDFRRVEQRLRKMGFVNDQSPDAPICRWRHGETIVDLMPMESGVLGFGNRWYPQAVELADRALLPDGQALRLVSAPVLLATKFDAFRSRGQNDLLLSHDLEDVMTLLDGRSELEDEAAAAPGNVREAIRKECGDLMADAGLLEAMAGFLPGDPASQARLPELQARLERLA